MSVQKQCRRCRSGQALRASGLVRGIGVFETPDQAEAVNSEEVFADFNSKVTPLISGSPERVELQLVHTFTA